MTNYLWEMPGSYGYLFEGLHALSEVLRMYMSNKEPLHVWCIDYCSLSTSRSYYSMQHLINILLFPSLHWAEPNTMASVCKMEVDNIERRSQQSDRNHFNQTQSECHPVNLLFRQGWQTQVETIHQRRKDASGSPGISKCFVAGKCVKLNSNVVGLDLWYLNCLELLLARGESNWSLKGNMMNLEEKEVRHQEGRSAWCGVWGGQGEYWWWWRSAEWNWGAQIQAEECPQEWRSTYPAEQPQKGREVKSMEWNRGAPSRGWGGDSGVPILEKERGQNMQFGALNEILKSQCRLRSAYGVWGASITADEHHWGGGGGGVNAAPLCVIDKCNGFCSKTINPCGRANYTLISILRTHNCNLLTSGILR